MMKKQHKIFLVEDDLSFGSVLKSYLELNDYAVDWINDGKYALDKFRKGVYDICILDIMLPNVDGFTIADEVRKINRSVPIVFLTAKKLKEDQLKGYNVGGDDYITKPFDTDILLCKIKAILTRNEANSPERDTYEIGRYIFNARFRTLIVGENEIKMSPKEGQLLEMLAQNVNGMISRESALKKIWGSDDYFTARSMDVYITKLRKYLADDPSLAIKNIHGSGFQLLITDQKN